MSSRNNKKTRRNKKQEEEPIVPQEELEWNENPIADEEVEPVEEVLVEQIAEEQETVEEEEVVNEEPIAEEEVVNEEQVEEEQESIEESVEEPVEEEPIAEEQETVEEEQEYLESELVAEEPVAEVETDNIEIPGTPEESLEEHSTIFIINDNIEEININSDIEDIIDSAEIQLTEEYPEHIDNITNHSTQTSEQPSTIVSKQPSPQVSKQPTPVVSKQPTPVVSKQPTPVVSKQPTPQVSKQPTPVVSNQPSRVASPLVSKQPTPQISKQPTPAVSNQPTPQISKQPTPQISKQPTPVVSKQPTPQVSKQPTPVVSKQPTPVVSKQPTPQVSKQPTPVVSKQATPVVSKQPTPQVSKQPTPLVSKQTTPATSREHTPRISPMIRAELMLAKNSNNRLIKENGIETTSLSKISLKEDLISELELPPTINNAQQNIEMEINNTISDNKKVTFDKMADYFSKNLGIANTIQEESPEDIQREAAANQVATIEYDPATMGMIRKRRVDRQLLANDLSSELPISLRYNENIHIDNEAEIENYRDEWTLWVEDGLDKLDELIMLLDELEIKYKGSSRRNRYTANSIQFLNLLLGSGIVYVQSSTTNAELIRDWNTVAGGLSTLSTMVYNYFGFAKKSTHYAVVASNINILNCWVKSKLILPLDKRFSPYDIYIIATKALQTILEEADQKKNDAK